MSNNDLSKFILILIKNLYVGSSVENLKSYVTRHVWASNGLKDRSEMTRLDIYLTLIFSIRFHYERLFSQL